MKQQFVSVVITANDDRPKAESWLRAAIENDLQAGESIFEFREKGGYLVNYFFMAYHTQSSYYNHMTMHLSWNNGSNYDAMFHAYASFPNANSGYSNTHELTGNGCVFLSIPSVHGSGSGERRIRFSMTCQNSNNGTYGTTNDSYTGFVVSKITDHTHAPS